MASCGYIYRYAFNSAMYGGVMKDIFAPEDFANHSFMSTAAAFSGIANEILKERLLKDAVRVSGYVNEWNNWYFNSDKVYSRDTHTALLIDIQPIEKKCEKHEPHRIIEDIVCTHCNEKLVARWEAE